MKRSAAAALILAAAVLFSACGSDGQSLESSESAVPETVTETETTTAAETGSAAELSLESPYVYAADADTGEVLYAEGADEVTIAASTTKLLTCLLAVENCSPDEVITYSDSAVALNSTDSSIGAVSGEQMSLEDALYGMMLPSGCDCANAIAEHVAGSVSAFCELMNQRAKELGCTSTYFSNPSGIEDWANYTTARDMFLIAEAAFSNNTLADIVSTVSYTIAATNMSDQRTVYNSNYLINPNSEYYDERVIGGKTGMTVEEHRCLVVLAKTEERSVICVLFDCPSRNGVFSDVTTILNSI